MKLGLVQYNPEWELKENNKKKLSDLLDTFEVGSDILIFPEMTLTGFTMKSASYAEKEDGETADFFSNIARQKKANVLAGIIENDNGMFFNSLLHFDRNGRLAAKYRKIHPFSYAGEDRNYAKGNAPVITEADGLKIGLAVCYDLRFPELFRKYAKSGTQLIVIIANWPETRIEHWRVLLKARAIENQCYTAGINRVGEDSKNKYNGFSCVFDPMGNEIVVAGNSECILTAEINSELVIEVRSRFPFLNDITLI